MSALQLDRDRELAGWLEKADQFHQQTYEAWTWRGGKFSGPWRIQFRFESEDWVGNIWSGQLAKLILCRFWIPIRWNYWLIVIMGSFGVYWVRTRSVLCLCLSLCLLQLAFAGCCCNYAKHRINSFIVEWIGSNKVRVFAFWAH